MSSIFSRFRRRAEPPGELAATPSAAPMPAAPGAVVARALTTSEGPPLDQVLAAMLDILDGYLPPPPPPPAPPRPAPSVSVASVRERAVGLGNRRGTETRGPFPIVALKGIRLDALVRFQLWATGPAQAETAAADLNAQLMADRNTLWGAGFLRLALEATPPAEYVLAARAWRKQADYRVLYEFHYQDTDGAESLIARIPINIDSEFGESTVVTDEMVRWDNQAAPALEVRGGVSQAFRVGALFILAFLPDGWDGNGVKVSASVGGTIRERPFPSVRAFLEAFTLEPGTVELGGKPYRAGRLIFPNADFPEPIILKGGEDFFRISYADDRFLKENETDAVVYLRVLS